MTRPLGFTTVAIAFGGTIALLLAHLTYAIGWHDDMQLAALYGFGCVVGAAASYLLNTLEH